MPEYSKSPKIPFKQQIYLLKALWGMKANSTWDIEEKQIPRFESVQVSFL
jgi:hypothetical protein